MKKLLVIAIINVCIITIINVSLFGEAGIEYLSWSTSLFVLTALLVAKASYNTLCYLLPVIYIVAVVGASYSIGVQFWYMVIIGNIYSLIVMYVLRRPYCRMLLSIIDDVQDNYRKGVK